MRKKTELVRMSTPDDLPVTQAAFEDYIISGQRLATDLAQDIAEEIKHMSGRDKVNCWARFAEVFFVTMPKGMLQSQTATDLQKESIQELLSTDFDDVEPESPEPKKD